MATVCATGCDHVSLVVAIPLSPPGELLELLDDPHVELATVVVDRSVTIRGSGGSTLDLRGAPGLAIGADEVRIEDLTLAPTVNRRLIDAPSSGVTLSAVSVTGSQAAVDGGVLYVTGSELTLEDCRFTGNDTSGNGAVVAAFAGSVVTVVRSTFDVNEAAVHGGAIYVDSSALVVAESAFAANHAAGNGGAVAVTGSTSTVAVDDSTFEGNAGSEGAALYVVGALTFAGSSNRFCADQPVGGGVVTTSAANFEWTDNVHRDGSGAGILVAGGLADIHDCDVVGNDKGLSQIAGSVTVRNVFFGWNDLAVERVTGSTTLAFDAYWLDVLDVAGVAGPGVPVVTGDPLLVYTPGACEEDLARDPASPLLGAGDPSLPDQDIGVGTGPTAGTTTTGTTPTTTGPPSTGPGADRTPSRPSTTGAVGCGCTAGDAPTGALALPALAVGLRRRRGPPVATASRPPWCAGRPPGSRT